MVYVTTFNTGQLFLLLISYLYHPSIMTIILATFIFLQEYLNNFCFSIHLFHILPIFISSTTMDFSMIFQQEINLGDVC